MALLIRLLQFGRNYKWYLAAAVLLVFIATGLGLLLPLIFGVIIDRLTEYYALGPSEKQLARPDIAGFVVTICWVLGGIYLVQWVGMYVRGLLLLFVSNRIVFDIRQRLFRHLMRLSLNYFESNPTGRIMARVLYDVEAVQSVLSGELVNIITNIITMVVVLVILYVYSWQLAIVATVALPLYVLNFLLLKRRIRHLAAEARSQYSQVYATLSEAIAGIRVIESFAREHWEARRFVHEIRQSMSLNIRVGRWRIILHSNANLLTQIANLAILGIGCYLILYPGTLSIGDLVAFRAYVGMLYGPIIALVTISDVINWASTAVERIFETLDTVTSVQEAKEPIRLDTVKGRVEMRHVDFAYEPSEPVLRDINLVAEPGEVTALVGPSGGGKTTVVHLVPRFYDPTSGQILIDAEDLRDVSLASLRQQIGMVMQESFLFSGTLRENIKYGKPKATDEEVVQAAIAANAHDFIMEFPDGYETRVGERGSRLSGGQRQRITIARAILSNPRILILDEATSDLDSESEALIQQALEYLMQGRTTFIIAHRLSTIINADRILVLDKGEIVEQGTHAELATGGGLYEKLSNVQFRQAQDKIEEYEAALAQQPASS